jgi:hypothetical protein
VDLRPVSPVPVDIPKRRDAEVHLRRQEATHSGTIPPAAKRPSPELAAYRCDAEEIQSESMENRSIYESKRVMEHNLSDTISLLSRTPAALDALLRDLPETWTYTDSTDQNQRTSDPWKSVKSASSAFHSRFPKISGSERKFLLTSGRI